MLKIQDELKKFVESGGALSDLSYTSRIPYVTLWRLLVGKVKNPQKGTAEKIQSALNSLCNT